MSGEDESAAQVAADVTIVGDSVSKLIRIRGAHRGAYTRLERKVDALAAGLISTDLQLMDAEALLKTLKTKYTTIRRYDAEVELKIDDEKLEDDMSTADDYEQKMLVTQARLVALIENYKKAQLPPSSSAAPATSSSAPRGSGTQMRLPKLALPTFTGSYSEWTSFADLFTAAVDSNTSLTDSEKLNYLKACVKGDAAKLISTITITDANYSLASKLLRDRYDNKRCIVQAHLQAIWNQSAMKSESASNLRKLLETTNEHLRALKDLGQPVDQWDSLLVFWIGDKMDAESRRQWQLDNPGSDLLTWKKLETFLDTRSRALECGGSVKAAAQSDKDSNKVSGGARTVQGYQATVVCCDLCSEDHRLHACPQFKRMTVTDRFNLVKKKRACFNCLSPDHSASECTSKFSCRECKGKHHTLLHRDKPRSSSDQQPSKHDRDRNKDGEDKTGTPSPTMASGHCSKGSPVTSVLLATAVVKVRNASGLEVPLRALLDSGSQASFITETMAKALMVNIQKGQATITTLGSGQQQKTKGLLSTALNDDVKVNLHVIPRITGCMPSSKIDKSQMRHVDNLPLADPTFNVPGHIDVLLGSDVIEDVMLDNRIRDNGLSIRDSIFGWVVSGPVNQAEGNFVATHVSLDVETNQLITKFWELDAVDERKHLSVEERDCEDHFAKTTRRKDDGRFIVQMPFKAGNTKLGLSKGNAMRRYLNLERKFHREPGLHERYCQFVQELLDMQHLERVPPSDIDNSNHFYLPHHCVLKDDSTTTKLRVVFDASAKSTSGFSLNDCLMVGPKLQDNLFDILVRFRFFKVAMSADVAKMYRQVELDQKDRDYHRLLWRFNFKAPVETYRMTRVIYGVASSAYHSIRALQECAKDAGVPSDAQQAIQRDFYVDDILTGAHSEEAAIKLQSNLISTLKKGQFDLRKWTSSLASVVLHLPEEYREGNENQQFLDKEHSIKTLGITWSPNQDAFSFKVVHLDEQLGEGKLTKREMLSDIAKVFDPLGWLSPVTVQLKQMMQQSWEWKIGWDEQLPDQLKNSYLSWRQGLHVLKGLNLERFILKSQQSDQVALHVFCDASEKAYAACIYVVSQYDDGGRKSSLLTAKSKISPLKPQTIPRLELCATLLGVRLLSAVNAALARMLVNVKEYHAWSDSTIVLYWLSKEPSHLSTFVANRVAEVQDSKEVNWHHVPTDQNPADVATRGIDPAALEDFHLWWKGPPWLLTDDYPESPLIVETTEELKGSKRSVDVHLSSLAARTDQKKRPLLDLQPFQSLSKALRVLSHVRRFVSLLVTKKPSPCQYITTEEIAESMNLLVLQEQKMFYADEIRTLETDAQVKKSSAIVKLYPFLYEGVLYVGGRLAQSNLCDSKKYQRIIHQDSELARLTVRHAHLQTLHGGTTQTMAYIRTKFWIPSCRNLVRKLATNCVTCHRFSAQPNYPLMGDLPRGRVDVPERAFLDVGLDFGGPFNCRKGPKCIEKVYMALYVCFASKAVHLELVSDLTAQACIAALRRFTSRRGVPRTIYSDNGSNFVASKAEIKEVQRLCKAQHADSLQAQAAALNMKWVFIPPKSPHFGGLWEAGIKSAKKHLRRTMGNKVLSFEELTTLLCQIECILNSRPICPLSEDPKDDEYLTPAHFTLGGKLECLPFQTSGTAEDPVPTQPIKRWAHLQTILGHFWKRWTNEYVTNLQQRSKWTAETSNLKVGDLVYICNDNAPPLQWPLGRVSYVYSGPDKFVRVVKVRTATGIYNRPVAKLRRLPIDD